MSNQISRPNAYAFLLAFLLAGCPGRLVLSQEATKNPALAVVRIRSHGGSATVIETRQGKSYLLTCAHILTDERLRIDHGKLFKPIKLDGPAQEHAPNIRAQARFVGYDIAADLALIELDNGPFYYVPVAPPGHVQSARFFSIGYDGLTWPPTIETVTHVATVNDLTLTREKPREGRSGGGLFDAVTGELVGVCQGYEDIRGGRGMYISHAAVVRFLARFRPQLKTPAATMPPRSVESGSWVPLTDDCQH